MAKQLAGKCAVVTGSTSGIGRAIAECFAREGASVMLNGFGEAKEIEALRSGLEKQHGVKALYHGADMSKPAEIAAMISGALKAFGKLPTSGTRLSPSTSRPPSTRRAHLSPR